MGQPFAVPDPNGHFRAPARVFAPKPSRHHTTTERSPRRSAAYTVPPPPQTQPAFVERRSPRRHRQRVPPPLIVQEVGPTQPAHGDSGFILPAPDPPVSHPSPLPSSEYPPSLQHRTSVRRPKTSSSSGASVPPAAPDAPPAVREQHHYHHHYYHASTPPPPALSPSKSHRRDASHSSTSTRGRSSTRHSSASRSPHTPITPRFPTRTNSTGGRSDRYSTVASEPEPQQRLKHNDKLSPELPQRSSSTRSTRYLEPSRRDDPFVIQNRDGSRVKRYYYA